jgi:hypothetical protein
VAQLSSLLRSRGADVGSAMQGLEVRGQVSDIVKRVVFQQYFVPAATGHFHILPAHVSPATGFLHESRSQDSLS